MLDSIRTRLTFWYVGVLALVLIAFAALTYFLVVRVLAKETDENLGEMAQNFKGALENEQADEPEKNSIEKSIIEVVNESRFRDYSFAVSTADGRQVASNLTDTNSDADLRKANSSAPYYSTIMIGGNNFRVHHIPVELGKNKYQLFVFHSLREETDFLARLRSIFFIAVPLALLITGLGGYFLARKSLAPVVGMSRQAATISATNLHERLPIKNERDELGDLARVFNDLLARLENSFEQQRRFMADASHELRTPLAIVRGESEVSLARENRSSAEYRESLAIVNDESKRLTKIVEDLFTLARADGGQFKAHFAEIYLDEILADCVHVVRTLAEKRRINIDFSAEEMPMRGDEQLLRRLFINLLDNAIKYNRAGEKVSITGKKNDVGYQIIITDSGAGIAKEEQAKIFERFYRVDKVRSRTEDTETSGAGLGLSIAQWIAELHQGELKLVNSDNTGSTFAVSFIISR